MKHYHVIACPFCGSEDLVKHGHNSSGVQRWRCNKCKKSFQPEYKYNAWKPGIKEAIIEQTLNSINLKDIAGNLEASTSAGSMKVSMKEVKDYVRLSNSGNVSLEVPKGGYNVDIRGRKINNNIKDFRGGFDSEKSMKGTIGNGGGEINIRSSGRVEISTKE